MSPRSPFADAAAALLREAPPSTRRLRHGTMPCGPLDLDPDLDDVFAPTPAGVDIDLLSYDFIIIAFSGGKDSLALLLLLLYLGVPRERLELWHHDVDGGEGSTLMDWPCTRGYCQAVADALGVRIYFSWKQGGLEGEMLRENAPTRGYVFETPHGLMICGGTSSKLGTRLLFPQTAASPELRWCSAYGKMMVAEAALRNDPRFADAWTLFLTGERGQESPKRAKYDVWQPHKADLRDGKVPRLIDHWRALLRWPASEVWRIIEHFKINPHPCYWLGWGRCSCAPCIFGNKDQWASLREVNPRQFGAVASLEASFSKTIDRKGRTVLQMADQGTPFDAITPERIRAALTRDYREPVFLDPWVLPPGAYGDACGPS
jgi:3'-phosphoadenosine 5'-phosphosulfate sulfotransferase (PAPS reductase)/FAD synthetase